MININQLNILELLCKKYNKKVISELQELVKIEEYIHVKEMSYGTSINFNKSYFILALGHLNEKYKMELVKDG